MTSRQQPKPDYSKAWDDLPAGDIGDTLLAQAGGRSPAQVVHAKTENGDIINLGSLPPSAIAEVLAARRRRQ